MAENPDGPDRTRGVDVPTARSDAGVGKFDENPYYWTYDGEPTLLLGGSAKDNLFQHVANPDVDVEGDLDALLACGGNYVRHTMQSRVSPEEADFLVQPFGTTADGRYDLETWNEEYWDRLDTVLEWTAERDVAVQLTFWDRFDFADYYHDTWSEHSPWNPANNVTYDAEESGLPTEWDRHPYEEVFPFMRAVDEGNELLLAYQERYVGKVLDHTLPYDHVLYNVSNETRAPKSWGDYWADFAHERADADDAGPVYVTQMYDAWDVTDEMHDRTHEDPGTYDYVDVSQNNQLSDQEHYDNLTAVRAEFADRPWPVNNEKCYGNDDGPHGSTRDGIERFWRSVFGGSASVRFHRPPGGLGIGPLAQTHVRAVRDVTDELDLAETEPATDRLADREPDEAYCLRDDATHLVFFTDGGSVTLDVDLPAGATATWYDVSNAEWGPESTVDGGAVRLDAPDDGYWVAVVSE